ncbi:hypothetical protein [Granulicatella sp. 20925_1_28]
MRYLTTARWQSSPSLQLPRRSSSYEEVMLTVS